MTRTFSVRLAGLEIFAEYPSATRGHTFIHHVVQGGELLVWIGRFHVIVTPPWWQPVKKAPTADSPSIGF